MSNKTTVSTKVGVIKAVINYLKENNIKEKECLYLESKKNDDEAYIIANRYARNYIHHGEKKAKDRFLKTANELSKKWVKNGNIWLEEDDVKIGKIESEKENQIELNEPSDEKYIEEIEIADKSIEERIETQSGETNSKIDGVSIIKSVFGNSIAKFTDSFIKELGIDAKKVGEKDGKMLYSCDGIGGIFEIID